MSEHPMVRHASTITVVLLTVVVGIMVLSQGFVQISDIQNPIIEQGIMNLIPTGNGSEAPVITTSSLYGLTSLGSREFIAGRNSMIYAYDIQSNTTNDITSGSGDTYGVISDGNGVFILSEASTSFLYYNESSDSTEGLTGAINAGSTRGEMVYDAPTNTVYVLQGLSSSGGIFKRYNHDTNEVENLAEAIETVSLSAGTVALTEFNDMVFDSSRGLFWLVSEDQDVLSFDPTTNETHQYYPDIISGNGVQAVTMTPDNNVLLSRDDKLTVLNPVTNVTTDVATVDFPTFTDSYPVELIDDAGLIIRSSNGAGDYGNSFKTYDANNGYAMTDIIVMLCDGDIPCEAHEWFVNNPTNKINKRGSSYYFVGENGQFGKFIAPINRPVTMGIFDFMLGITFLIAGIVVISVIGKRMIS